MAEPTVSILIPHYQTAKLTEICLRLLRRHTKRSDYEAILIDNGSMDESTRAFESWSWLRVVRREPIAEERPACAHGRALNFGLVHARSERILVMHTDTMIVRDDWLDFLIERLEAGGSRCGAVGSWKMEVESPWRRAGKWIESVVRAAAGRQRRERRYLRSHCAIYRRRALESRRQMFDPGETGAAGEALHADMLASGWTTMALDPAVLGRYVRHLNHATMALNLHMGASDKHMPRTRARSIRRIESFFESRHVSEALSDVSVSR